MSQLVGSWAGRRVRGWVGSCGLCLLEAEIWSLLICLLFVISVMTGNGSSFSGVLCCFKHWCLATVEQTKVSYTKSSNRNTWTTQLSHAQ